jgi:uncharacterized protein YjbJ (UPF0337 family)
MVSTHKAKNTAQTAKGQVKEAAGNATGDRKLRARGKADQRKGGLEAGRGETQGRGQQVDAASIDQRERERTRP